MNRATCFFLLLSTIIIAACNSNEIGDIDDVNPDKIYFDYKVWGEQQGDMNVMLQFRFAGPNGTTLFLGDRGKVELDGKILAADSSKITGVWYEAIIPVQEFTGDHIIRFTNIDGSRYEEKFSFRPVNFINQLPDTVSRQDLNLELSGLEATDFVRLILTDTSFNNDGIRRFDTIKNGRIVIKAHEFDSVSNGPLHLELYREYEKDVREGTSEGGRLSITYALKREIFLKD